MVDNKENKDKFKNKKIYMNFKLNDLEIKGENPLRIKDEIVYNKSNVNASDGVIKLS